MGMSTYEFLVALATNAGTPFAFMVGTVAACVAAPIVVRGIRKSAERRAIIESKREVDIKTLEVSKPNGAIALTKRNEEYDG